MEDVLSSTVGFLIVVLAWSIGSYQITKYILRVNMRKRIGLKLTIYFLLSLATLYATSILTPFWNLYKTLDELTLVQYFVDSILQLLVVFLCAFLMLKEKWYYIALYSIASYYLYVILLATVSYFIEILLSILQHDTSEIEDVLIIMLPALMVVLIFIIGRIFKRDDKVLFSNSPKRVHLYIYILIQMNYYICSGIFNAYSDSKSIFSLIIITIVFVISVFQILAIIYMVNTRIILKERHSLNQEYLKLQEEHYQSIMEKDLKLRKLRHDMRHHLYMLRMLNEEGEQEEMNAYLNSIADTLDKGTGLS